MRQRSSRSSGHQQDLTEQILSLIRSLEAAKTPCTKSTLVKQLSSQFSISTDKAENALDLAIRQGRIIELFSTTQTSSEPVCHDLLRLK
jgi:DNA replicative helicase MCM subunit Mcm2 (Cdc46/Mcm family)